MDTEKGEKIMIEDGKKRLLTMSEVLKRTRIGEKRIKTEIREGRLKAYKIGMLWRFNPDHVEEWLENQLVTIKEIDA